jgi:hypothetical protein
VPGEGLEPSWPFSQRILSPLRLPIPPPRPVIESHTQSGRAHLKGLPPCPTQTESPFSPASRSLTKLSRVRLSGMPRRTAAAGCLRAGRPWRGCLDGVALTPCSPHAGYGVGARRGQRIDLRRLLFGYGMPRSATHACVIDRVDRERGEERGQGLAIPVCPMTEIATTASNSPSAKPPSRKSP